jgi:pimeloyl-ACP methyl ester carboxylesterase
MVADTYRRVRIKGVELAYMEQGSGPPFIYVHGALSDVRYLQPELPALAQRLRTIVYSRRYAWPNEPLGEGASDPVAQHVDDLADFIRALNAAPAHVAGISLGGTICLLLAVRHPELVRTLILEDPSKLIPNSEVNVIPGASHGMNFQNPVALDAAILDFLARHPAA